MGYGDRPIALQRKAPATYVILGINIAVFVLLELSGGSTNALVLLRWGAKFAPAIKSGEWWRLITSMFLHAGILHLAANSYSLYNLGNFVERLYGTPRYVALYVMSGLWGSLFSTILSDPRILGVGASGAIFGLVGGIFYFGLRFPRHFSMIAGMRFIFVVAINLFIGFASPLIDNYAHIGGLIGGFAAAYVLGLPGEDQPLVKRASRAAFALVTAMAIAIAVTP